MGRPSVLSVILLICLSVVHTCALTYDGRHDHFDDEYWDDDEFTDVDVQPLVFSDRTNGDNSISDDVPMTSAVDQPQEVREHPCRKVKCSHGMECVTDKSTGEPTCVCIRECPETNDIRRRVCSNYNTTWPSDCHLHRQRCLCSRELTSSGADGSTDAAHVHLSPLTTAHCTPEYAHMHIDYYGTCMEIDECQVSALKDFPRRMREWLTFIMTSPPTNNDIVDPEEPEKTGQSLRHKLLAQEWLDSVIWKFCDGDRPIYERYVSRHELFPIRAPLLAMEPCISTFLNQCDADDDHSISFYEWIGCLEMKESELNENCYEFKGLRE